MRSHARLLDTGDSHNTVEVANVGQPCYNCQYSTSSTMSTRQEHVGTDKHELDHREDEVADLSAQALDEEIALLEGTDTRGRTSTHGDGDATYRHETWGFIGEALYSRLNRALIMSLVKLRRNPANLYNPGYMVPIFGNQLLWRYFSILGPITQMGKHGSLALAGGALGELSYTRTEVEPYLTSLPFIASQYNHCNRSGRSKFIGEFRIGHPRYSSSRR